MNAKNVYFCMLGCDIGMYAKYYQNIFNKTTHGKRTGNVDCDQNTSDEEKGRSVNSRTTRGQALISHQDSSTIIDGEGHGATIDGA